MVSAVVCMFLVRFVVRVVVFVVVVVFLKNGGFLSQMAYV